MGLACESPEYAGASRYSATTLMDDGREKAERSSRTGLAWKRIRDKEEESCYHQSVFGAKDVRRLATTARTEVSLSKIP